MSTILIKSKGRENDRFLLELAKRLKLRARVLNEEDESDLLLIKAIDEGMKSGEGTAKAVKKILGKHGAEV